MLESPPRTVVGDATVDLRTGEIQRGGETTRVTPKAAETLAVLCERPGQAVSKQQLLERVWADTFVTDDGVWHCIAELRRVFGDDARSPRVIETLPRRGYRLIAAVSPAGPPPPIATPSTRASRFGRLGRASVAIVPALLLALIGWRALAPEERNRSDRAEALVVQGREAYGHHSSGHNEWAIELFEEAADLAPANARAQAGLADAYAMKSMYYSAEPWWSDRALQAARRAIELDPDLAEGHKALGLALASKNRLREAGDAYRRALELHPGHVGALNNLGLIESTRGNLAEAARRFREADRIQPGDTMILTNLGTTYRLLGMEKEAIETLEAAAEAEGGDRSVINVWQRALLDLDRGAIDAARLRLDAASDRIKREPSLWLHAGEVELIAGRLRQACEHYRHALPAPRGWDARPALAWLRCGGDVGQPADALMREFVAMEQATSYRDLTSATLDFAAVRLALGERGEALGWLEAAVERGYRDRAWLALDPLLADLRGNDRLVALERRIDRLVTAEREALLRG